jgi:SAM-dependent methyltransferase
LFSDLGVKISDQVILRHTIDPIVTMVECNQCKLWHFYPAMSGDSEFYSELTSLSPKYYNQIKWEFGIAKSLILHGNSVLDVACGTGAFLRSINDIVGDAVGVDTNPSAVGLAKKAGLKVFEKSIEQFATENTGRFEVVTAFQVIEHIESIMPFLLKAYQCVRPGGILVVSVPNRERRTHEGFEPLDYPPHHLSRWSDSQLRTVAELLKGDLLRIYKEPITDAQLIRALREREMHRLVPCNFPGKAFFVKAFSRTIVSWPLSVLWRKFRIAERLGIFGMSMVAVIQKPK